MNYGDIFKYIDRSVLCWLATVDANGQPNVSPKEIFTHHDGDIIIANIMSPQSIKNIKANPKVSVSFIDAIVQKGYQVKGRASIITKKDQSFNELHFPLFKLAGSDFPIASIIKIKIESSKKILAPRYVLFPETKELDQIARAKKQYK